MTSLHKFQFEWSAFSRTHKMETEMDKMYTYIIEMDRDRKSVVNYSFTVVKAGATDYYWTI